MSNEKISRRDWFRLNKAPLKQSTIPSAQTKQTTVSQNGLKPVTAPINHIGLDLSQLPPMTEAELVAEQVDDLISDIRQCADQVTLMHRGISELVSGETRSAADQLLLARNELRTGRLSRIQIRYHWDGFRWIDTIEAQHGRFRLVRIRHDL
jgi:hypothetical protein